MGKPTKPVNNVKTPPFSSGLWKKGGVLDHDPSGWGVIIYHNPVGEGSIIT